MKLVSFYYLDENTKEDVAMENVFVASTKEQNNTEEKLPSKYTSVKVLKDNVYLDRDNALRIAEDVAESMGYASNLYLIDHVVKALETACLVKRLKND